MGFANLESRTASVGMRMLANASATVGGGEPFGVIFDRRPSESLGIVGGYGPRVHCLVADVAGIAEGDPLDIDGSGYVVAEVDAPDAGIVSLRLEAA